MSDDRIVDNGLEPPELVVRVEAVVGRLLAPVGDREASISLTYADAAGMWFVDVTPGNSLAASISVGIANNDNDFLVGVPNAHWEIWAGDAQGPPLAELERQLEAIVLGRIETAGRGPDRPAVLRLTDGTTSRVGRARLPIPWRWRRRTSFDAYGGDS